MFIVQDSINRKGSLATSSFLKLSYSTILYIRKNVTKYCFVASTFLIPVNEM